MGITRWKLKAGAGASRICIDPDDDTSALKFPCGCEWTFQRGLAEVEFTGADKGPSMDINAQNAVLHAINFQTFDGGDWTDEWTDEFGGVFSFIHPTSHTKQALTCGAFTLTAFVSRLTFALKWGDLEDFKVFLQFGTAASTGGSFDTSGGSITAYVSNQDLTTIAQVRALTAKATVEVDRSGDKHYFPVFEWAIEEGFDPDVDGTIYLYMLPTESHDADYSPILASNCWVQIDCSQAGGPSDEWNQQDTGNVCEPDFPAGGGTSHGFEF